jgi:ataxin-7
VLQTHSLTHRRAVPGRRRTFDLLLAEHKGRTKKEKEAQEEAKREREGAQGRKEAQSSLKTTTPSRPHCPNGRPLSTLKLRLANAHIPRFGSEYSVELIRLWDVFIMHVIMLIFV